MTKLKLVKRLMVKTKLLYRGTEMNLWDFAETESSCDYSSEKVIFDEKVRKGKLITLSEALTDCEIFVAQIF